MRLYYFWSYLCWKAALIWWVFSKLCHTNRLPGIDPSWPSAILIGSLNGAPGRDLPFRKVFPYQCNRFKPVLTSWLFLKACWWTCSGNSFWSQFYLFLSLVWYLKITTVAVFLDKGTTRVSKFGMRKASLV